MKHIESLLEHQEIKTFLDHNEDTVEIVEQEIELIPDMLKSFALSNLDEFVAEDIHETYKNIRTFAEVATQQAIVEISSIYGNIASEEYVNVESTIDDYL